MQGRRQKSKGTTPCPYCSCAVNNFHIGRHISREHTHRAAASTLLTRDVRDRNTPPPNNDGPVRDVAQIEDDYNNEAVITDDEYDEDDELVTSDDDDDSNNEAELDDEDDEAEKTVEDCAT